MIQFEKAYQKTLYDKLFLLNSLSFIIVIFCYVVEEVAR